mgnify:FL=1|jgi:ppic-type ppiase domain protein, putative
MALVLSVLMMTTVIGCGSGTDWSSGKDAIKVNDEVLKSGYLDSRIKQVFVANGIEEGTEMADTYRAGIVKSAVDLTLLLQEAAKRNITATDEEVANLKKELVAQAGSEEAFNKDMEDKGISAKDTQTLLKQQVIFNKLQDNIKSSIKIDSKGYYDSHPDEFKQDEQVKASHILVKTEEEANKVIAELKAGKDFAELAKTYSTDESNKNNGGDLGYFDKSRMVAPFANAAFSMEVGTFSQAPVKTEFGYHVIKVEDKKPAGTQSYEEVKKQLEEFLINNELQLKISELTNTLNKNAKIEYLLEDYDPAKLEEKAQKAIAEAQAKAAKEAQAQAGAANSGEASQAGATTTTENTEQATTQTKTTEQAK